MRIEDVLLSGGSAAGTAVPLTRRQQGEQTVSGVGNVLAMLVSFSSAQASHLTNVTDAW